MMKALLGRYTAKLLLYHERFKFYSACIYIQMKILLYFLKCSGKQDCTYLQDSAVNLDLDF